jgi:hypothetical protein
VEGREGVTYLDAILPKGEEDWMRMMRWDLPKEVNGFVGFLSNNYPDVTLQQAWRKFQTLPAFRAMPRSLKAQVDVAVAIKKSSGTKTGGGGQPQPYVEGGLYTGDGHGEPSALEVPWPGTYQVFAERSTTMVRRYVEGVRTKMEVDSWRTNGDPYGNMVNPLSAEAQENLGKIGNLTPESKFKETRSKVRELVDNATPPTVEQVESFKRLDALCKGGDDNACRRISGNGYEKRERRNWILKEWGDGHTCPCGHCGVRIGSAQMEIDKIYPAKRYTKKNIIPSCADCNRKRPGGSSARNVADYTPEQMRKGFVRTRRSVRIGEGRKVAAMQALEEQIRKHKPRGPNVIPDTYSEVPVTPYRGRVNRDWYNLSDSSQNDRWIRFVPRHTEGPLLVVDIFDADTDAYLWSSVTINGWSVDESSIERIR